MPKRIMPGRAALAAAALGAVLAAALATGGSPALAAGNGGGCTGYTGGGGWWVTCGSGGGPGRGGGGGSSQHQSCFWTSQSSYFPPGFKRYAPPPPRGFTYLVQVCGSHGQYTSLPVLVSNAGPLTPQVLAQRAWAELRPPVPTPHTAPPRGHDGLVGLPEWVWIPGAEWETLTQSLAAGPVWAQVTATPAKLTITPGGALPPLSCPGPGTPYNPAQSAGAQHSDCAITYTQSSDGQPSNAYTVTVTTTWTATWRGSGGTGGTLPALTRSATFPLRIAEGQGLDTGSGG